MANEAGQHVIVAPVDDADGWISDVRRRHDPLAALVPPHFTLVYPFDGSIEVEALHRHMVQALAAVRPFHVTLAGLSGAEQRYLRYDIKQGNDTLIALHDQLYSGLLASFLDRSDSYQPHMTVGRIDDPVAWRHALDELVGAAPRMTVAVRRVISYRRYPDGRRQIDNVIDL